MAAPLSHDDEIVSLHEHFYIQATSSRTDDRTRVLKHGETFAVFDRFGDVQPVGLGEQGVYHDGTRFLSRLELRLGGRRPLLLSSTVKKENELFTVDLTNPDLKTRTGQIGISRGSLHVFRTKFLWHGTCHERLRVSNFQMSPVETELTLAYAADYADIFEVRGTKRPQCGRREPPAIDRGAVILAYQGLDEVVRATRITFDPAPDELAGHQATFHLKLPPREGVTIHVTYGCEMASSSEPSKGSEPPAMSSDRQKPVYAPRDPAYRPVISYERAFAEMQVATARGHLSRCRVQAQNSDLDEWIARSVSDLEMMITETPHGPYPYAGVPWFSTPFGRDGIITALEVLWLAPDVARGVLSYLAATQATEVIPERDAQPGKILHEARGGEMPALGEVPFGRYYGSVDATPLFVMLAAAYYKRTGDVDFLRRLTPNIGQALGWIDRFGDVDHDGFVEYERQTPIGLVHQGWKDSHDSVFHADGTLAEGPIALCEVQGYVFAAWQAAAEIAIALGRPAEAEDYTRRAAAMRARFAEHFWDEELGTYVLALDGAKRPCRVPTSNAGHALWTGIADATRARRVAETLMSDEGFSGWGVRTLAASQARYNPMSYHNGSVWPHDTAIVASGCARYGFRDSVVRLFEGMREASVFVDLHRLPELTCGFPRRPGEGPTLYPVACAPQAWASGAVFMLLSAALGLSIDGHAGELTFLRPILPPSVPSLRITGLPVGSGRVDLLLDNHPHDVGITVLRRDGDARVVVIK
jgi:glycogen debranching enzyme